MAGEEIDNVIGSIPGQSGLKIGQKTTQDDPNPTQRFGDPGLS